MANKTSPEIFHMVLIAERKLKDNLLAALSEKGCHVINTCYVNGTSRAGFLMKDLVYEDNRVFISCLVSGGEADAIFEMLADDFNFDKANTGIAYTIPVEKLSY